MKTWTLLLLSLAACAPFSGTDPEPTDAALDAPAHDAAVLLTDAGTPTACDGGYVHTFHIGSSGTDGTWTDCSPPGTHNADEAMDACVAYCAASDSGCTCSAGSICDGGNMAVTLASDTAGGQYFYGWSWSAPDTGKVLLGSDAGCGFNGSWQ